MRSPRSSSNTPPPGGSPIDDTAAAEYGELDAREADQGTTAVPRKAYPGTNNVQQRMKKQALAIGLGVLCAVAWPAAAQVLAPPPATPDVAGFYGGLSLRDPGKTESLGVNLAPLGNAWGKFSSPMTDDAPSQSLVFGGYRFGNDVALEASFGLADRYVLQPSNPSGRRGVGLSLLPSDSASRTWNADVYTTWSFLRRFSLYGRLGYAQTDNGWAATPYTVTPDARRRDGVNYGLGLRYDVNRALGLRLEYARFNRFAGEIPSSGVLPESDQVQLGVQLRF
jgi:opacity protein-like surface antigen